MSKIFFPINISNSHWTLAVLFIESKRIQYYDSLVSGQQQQDKFLKSILNWLSDESKIKKGVDIERSEWELVYCTQENTPQQTNGVDCGVFTIMFADFITDDLDINRISQNHMPHFRNKICSDILNASQKTTGEDGVGEGKISFKKAKKSRTTKET